MRQRTQRAARAALAQALGDAPRVLAGIQTDSLSLPWQDTHDTLCRHDDCQSNEGRSQEGRHQETSLPPCPTTFLRDGTAGSWSRSTNNQQTAGTRQLHHHDGLSPLPPRTLGRSPQSAGLATRETAPDLPATGREPACHHTEDDTAADQQPHSDSGRALFTVANTTDADTSITDSYYADYQAGLNTDFEFGANARWRDDCDTSACEAQAQVHPEEERLTVHRILCRGAADYVDRYRDTEACAKVQSVLAKISCCRTAALGGRWYQCDDCSEVTKLYNSCGDRHCPACTGAKRATWSDRVSKYLLPGVEYYQVIFTLPEILSQLALANRRQLTDLLFHSAQKAINRTVRQEQGYEPASLMVLHTWNQKLESHWHVHAMVPGGGPSLTDPGAWKAAQPPRIDDEPARHTTKKYLVDAINLRQRFRKVAIKRLEHLRAAGKLKFGGSLAYLEDEVAWQAMIEELKGTEWVSHIEAPQGESSDPQHVVRYLTRYLTGGPIGSSRLLSADEHNVTFLARTGNKTGGEREQEPYTLSTLEFVRRWCLHIQPEQLTKTRFFGGWSTGRSERYLARCRAALQRAGLWPEPEPDLEQDEQLATVEPMKCSHCQSINLTLCWEREKPSWKDVLAPGSAGCPAWYTKSKEWTISLVYGRFLDQVVGVGCWEYADDDPEPWVESAKELEDEVPEAEQMWLPGLAPSFDWQLVSF